VLNRIHHISIICSDYEKSKYFYTGILGLEIIRETYRGERRSYKLDLSLNGEYAVELFSFPDPPERLTRPEAAGLRHLAFEVDNLNDVIKILSKKDVIAEPVRVDETTGKKFTFIFDPDNLPVELYEK
jgi:glyoxylase I family protein